jgi:hypothetical protein
MRMSTKVDSTRLCRLSLDAFVFVDNGNQAATSDSEQKNNHVNEPIVTVDLHNIIDLVKQLFQESEQRIIGAMKKADSSSSSSSNESYRTADRKKNTNDNEKKNKNNNDDDDDDDD